jgi:prepilin-type N-terminal cleavage/methylation domain-containing protein
MQFKRTKAPGRSGYTLIELLMVIGIIGVVAVIALPHVRLEQSMVDGAVRTVNMSLMAAQSESVARGHNVLVLFDTTNHVVRTVWDQNNNEQLDAGEKTRPFPLPERVVLGRGQSVPQFKDASAQVPSLKVISGMPAVVFQRNGSADRSVTMYFTSYLARNGGKFDDTRAMQIERATGRPVWYVWSGSQWRRN